MCIRDRKKVTLVNVIILRRRKERWCILGSTNTLLKHDHIIMPLFDVRWWYEHRSLRARCSPEAVSYTHLRAHETPEHLVCRLLLEKKKKNIYQHKHYPQ
eukprot:TRINITY_DN27313_c0_g1_i2.p1 TRINITY_DN27313_c0_g1~~TRINITY_DN27313_c0_g1_i2.p1  ORF type:complete len:100 (+),score=14.98 TRINITY_DN27313_c0_g1_i2:166-465(+)